MPLFYFRNYHYIAGSGPLQWKSKSFVHFYLSNWKLARWLLTTYIARVVVVLQKSGQAYRFTSIAQLETLAKVTKPI